MPRRPGGEKGARGGGGRRGMARSPPPCRGNRGILAGDRGTFNVQHRHQPNGAPEPTNPLCKYLDPDLVVNDLECICIPQKNSRSHAEEPLSAVTGGGWCHGVGTARKSGHPGSLSRGGRLATAPPPWSLPKDPGNAPKPDGSFGPSLRPDQAAFKAPPSPRGGGVQPGPTQGGSTGRGEIFARPFFNLFPNFGKTQRAGGTAVPTESPTLKKGLCRTHIRVRRSVPRRRGRGAPRGREGAAGGAPRATRRPMRRGQGLAGQPPLPGGAPATREATGRAPEQPGGWLSPAPAPFYRPMSTFYFRVKLDLGG